MTKSKQSYKYEVPTGFVAVGGQLRLYPNDEQKCKLYQAFGNARYVWNLFKYTFDERYKNNKDFKFPSKTTLYHLLKVLKQEHAFLKLSDSTSLQTILDNFKDAQWSYMKHKTGKPKFKSKNYYIQRYTSKNNSDAVRLAGLDHIRLPKIGIISTSNTSSFKNIKIFRATITWRQDVDRFYVSFTGIKPKPNSCHKTGKAVGIDLGLGNEWLVTSNGERWFVPDTKKLEKRQVFWQSKIDKKLVLINKYVREYNKIHGKHAASKYDFKTWQVLRKIKSKYAIKMHNIRLDQVRKAVKYLIDNYDVIVIEDLKVKNLLKNHKLAKSINNASWYLFKQVLAYECKCYGKQLIIVPPQYTSRTCSNCHKRNPAFTHMKTNQWLAVRSWTCPFCGANHDRDVNAAINILNKGIK